MNYNRVLLSLRLSILLCPEQHPLQVALLRNLLGHLGKTFRQPAFGRSIFRAGTKADFFAIGDAVSVPGKLTASPTGQLQDRHVVGSYVLRPNRPGLGAHVSNASFIVARSARGLGVGRAMGEHCLSEARRLGFRAMQFNFVVSTNESAVHLWQQLGFKIVGTLPGAFRHSQKGYVDVYVMFRSLLD